MPLATSRARFAFAARGRMLHGVLLACALSTALAPAAHAADEKDKAVLDARQKFRQAISMQTGGNWAAALQLFRDVAAVKNTPQVRFNIAICEENLGQLVQALGDYQLAATQAREEGSLQVAGEVDGRLTTLQERIPKVVIQRDEKVARAKISIDGVEVGFEMLGKPMPVDPGGHAVDAEAKGFTKFEKAFDVAERQAVTVQIEMVALPAGAEAPASTAAAPAQADKGAPPPAKGTNIVPYVIGGVGAASLVASGVFFVLRQKAISDLDAACPSRTNCAATSDFTSKQSSGQTDQTLAYVTLGVGIAGLGAGALMLLLAPSSSSGSDTAVRLTPGAALADVGASVVGRF